MENEYGVHRYLLINRAVNFIIRLRRYYLQSNSLLGLTNKTNTIKNIFLYLRTKQYPIV